MHKLLVKFLAFYLFMLSGSVNALTEAEFVQSLLLEQIEASINYHKNRIKYDSLMDRLLVSAL